MHECENVGKKWCHVMMLHVAIKYADILFDYIIAPFRMVLVQAKVCSFGFFFISLSLSLSGLVCSVCVSRAMILSSWLSCEPAVGCVDCESFDLLLCSYFVLYIYSIPVVVTLKNGLFYNCWTASFV